jgi:hypothetical protein
MVHAVLLRVIWLIRNDICFNRVVWPAQMVWRKTAWQLAQWEVLLAEGERGKLQVMIAQLEGLARAPPMLLWPEPG